MGWFSSVTKLKRANLLVVLLSLAAIVTAFISLDYITKRLLKQHAFTVGMHWAEDIESGLDNLDCVFAGKPEKSNVLEVLQPLSLVGRIYRYEFIDPSGKVVLSTGSHTLAAQKTDMGRSKAAREHSRQMPENDHRVGHNLTSPDLAKEHSTAKQLHSSHKTNSHLTDELSHSHGEFTYEMPHLSISELKRHNVVLSLGDGIEIPKYTARVNHPIVDHGKYIGSLGLYIDQTDIQALLRKTMLVVFAILGFLSVFTLGLPTILILWGRAKEKRIQLQLTRQNHQFDMALSNISQGLCVFDKHKNLIIANDQYAKVYNLEPDEIKPGTALDDIIKIRIERGTFSDDSQNQSKENLDQWPKSKWISDNIKHLNDGRYIEVHKQPMPEGGWLSTHEDITERVLAEEKIRAQNERFNAAIANIPVGFCMFDKDGILIVSNHKYAEIYELSPDLLKPGISLNDILKLRFENNAFFGKDLQEYSRKTHDWTRFQEDSTVSRQLENGRHIKIIHHPMGEGGWLAVHEDITEQNRAEQSLLKSEEMLSKAFKANPIPVFMVDVKTGEHIDVNEAWVKSLGYSIEDVIGKTALELDLWVDIEDRNRMLNMLQTNGSVSEFSAKQNTKDGREIDCLLSVQHLEIAGEPRLLFVNQNVTERLAADKELREHRDHLQDMIDAATVEAKEKANELATALKAMNQGLCMYDADWNLVVSNDQYAEIYNIPSEKIKPGINLQEVLAIRVAIGAYVGSDPDEYMQGRNRELQIREYSVRQYPLNDGRYIEIRDHPLPDGGWLSTHDDVTERVTTENALSSQNQRFDAAISNMSHGLAMFDHNHNIIISNDRYATIYGLEADDIQPGMNLEKIIELRIENGCYIGNSAREYLEEMKDLENNRTGTPRTYLLNDDRSVEIRDHQVGDGGFLTVHEDVTDRQDTAKKIKYLADYDTLTCLPNRTQIHEILKSTILQTGKHDDKMALMYIDLDGFKEVNDTLGHPVGDQVLNQIGARLAEFQSDTIIAGRLSGDEFLIIVKEFNNLTYLEWLGDQICTALATPIRVAEDVIDISASIGIAVGPPENGESDIFIQFADIALYQAKADGGNRYLIFKDEMYIEAKKRKRMAADLRNAIPKTELLLHYQPQIDLRNGKINGYEALLRWQHSEMGMVSPIQFIEMAEETGQICEIGEWVLRTACEYAVSWPNREKLSVNLSPIQFKRQDVITMVKRVLWETGFEPERLELEITEGVLIQSTDSVIVTLRGLAEMGVSIALDDFGTGFSSLSYLTTFPFHKIKIDKSFINDLGKDSEVTSIVSMIIGLGRNLDTIITAEGIENSRQHELLRVSGCDQGQGYLYGRPEPLILDNTQIEKINVA